jgi:phosphate starvation-inducible PhoH-like protein
VDPSTLFDNDNPTPRLTKSQARKARNEVKKRKGIPASGPLTARTLNQRRYIQALYDDAHIFAIGPAGTGKTYVPARIAARKLVDGMIDKIIVARVAVSRSKHQLGFLPGKLDAKMRPWMIPIFDGIKAEVGSHLLDQWMQDARLEVVSFEHLRGRTLGSDRTILILDEAQNADLIDLRLFLTRIGEQTQCIVTGDLEQIDIPNSGLAKVIAISQAHDVPMEIIHFSEEDVVRSAFVAAWVRAFRADQEASGANLDRLPDFVHTPRVINRS